MFVTVHTAVGLALTQNFTSPLLAAGVAFISHWILDIIPHGDEVLSEKLSAKGWSRTKIGLALGLPDTIVLVISFLAYLILVPPLQPIVMIAAALGAVLPDILWGLATIIKWQWLQTFDRWHEKTHNLLGRKILPMWAGFSIQAIIMIAALWLLFS